MSFCKTKSVRARVIVFAIAVIMTLTAIAASSAKAYNALAAGVPPFASDFSNREDILTAGLELNIAAVEEGAVLLKNDGALPLSNDSLKVTVFGKNSVKSAFSGGGSSGTPTPLSLSIYQSMHQTGITYNPYMKAFYDDESLSGPGRRVGNTGIVGATGAFIGETRAVGDVNYADWNALGVTEANKGTKIANELNYDPSAESNYSAVRSSYANYSDAAIVQITRNSSEGADNPRTMRGTIAAAGLKTANITANYEPLATAPLVPGASSTSDHYQQLSLSEINAIKEACYYFDNVIVIINSSAQFELGFLDDPADPAYSPNIKGALWIGNPGENGFVSVCNILTGKANPSGGLVDTYYRNFNDDPTWLNWGDNMELHGNKYGVGGNVVTNAFVDYQEGIYLGYRYYETRYAELKKIWDAAGDKTGLTDPDVWYKNNVVFPFGYGLSYTDFSVTVANQKLDGTSFSNGESLSVNADSTFNINVKVKNTGSVAGKKTIQLFVEAPYTDGKIEKPVKVLAGYEKTRLLAPGAEQTLSIPVSAYSFASYDYGDLNANGFRGYELDSGAYVFHVADDSHNTVSEVSFDIAVNVKFTNDPVTGTPVVNLYDYMSDHMKNNSVVLSRNNNFANLSQLTNGATRKNAAYVTQAFIDTLATTSVANSAETVFDLAKAWEETGAPKNNTPYPSTQTTTALTYEQASIKFFDMFGVSFDDPKWDSFLDQLTFSQMSYLLGSGGYTTVSFDAIGKPATSEWESSLGMSQPGAGGQVGMSMLTFARVVRHCSPTVIAASFNKEIAKERGRLIGEEALWDLTISDTLTTLADRGAGINGRGINGIYSPATNIHRSPFGGRNFEYYSEDGYLAGTIMAEMVNALHDKGVMTYIKHFFLNDQDTDRAGVATWADEQTMREVYAKPFEIAIKQSVQRGSKLMALMSSMNRIGKRWSGSCYASMTSLLRNEWGFRGVVINDSGSGNSYMNAERGIIAGNDKCLHSQATVLVSVKDVLLNDAEYGNSYKWAIRNAAKHVLYTTANTNIILAKDKIFTQPANLTTANNNASGQAAIFYFNKPVSYNLKTDLAATAEPGRGLSFRPVVYYGDRSTVNFTYSLAPGYSLPKGLTLSSTGVISGTPTEITTNSSGQSAAVAVRIKISATGYRSTLQDITLRVNGNNSITGFTNKNLGTAAFGQAFNSDVKTMTTAMEVAAPYAVKYRTTSDLPAGLTLNTDGTITGTPTQTTFGYYAIDIIAEIVSTEDSNAVIDSAKATFTLTVGQVKDGTNGADGTNGTDGTNGAKGLDGATGISGKDAPIGLVTAALVVSIVSIFGAAIALVLLKRKKA